MRWQGFTGAFGRETKCDWLVGLEVRFLREGEMGENVFKENKYELSKV